MRKSSAKILIFSILFVAIFAIVASCLFVTLSVGNAQTYFSSEYVNISEVASTSDFYAGTKSNTNRYGMTDGEVVSPYSHGLSNPTTVTQASDIVGKTSGNYILASDTVVLNLTNISTSVFAGTFDGCGHTITITNTTSLSSNSSANRGSLFGELTGTIKNVHFKIQFNYNNTHDEPKCWQAWGGIVGKINGGTFENCYVELTGNCFWQTNTSRDGTQVETLGVVAGEISYDGSMENVTVDMKTYSLGWQNNKGSGGLFGSARPDYRACIGAFAGITYGKATLTNISIYGSGSIYATGNNSYGNERAYVGAIVGWQGDDSSNLIINGLKYSYTGTISTSKIGGTNYYNSLGGEWNRSLSLSNIFYTSSSKFSSMSDYYNGSSATNATGVQYSIDNNRLGFVGDNLWIGEFSNYSGTTTSITGNYVNSITIGSAINISSLASNGTSGTAYIPYIAKSSVNGTISAYTKGKYAYIKNEVTNIELTYNDSTPTVRNLTPSSNAATTAYTGYTATPVITEQIYRGGSTEATIDFDSWTSKVNNVSAAIKNVATYSLTKTYSSGQWSSAGNSTYDYYLVSEGSFTATITVSKASLERDTSSNYSGTYDGSAHYITCNATGFLGSDIFANTATVYYSGTSEADANTTNNTTNIGITHVSESVKTIYYRIEFDNYETITGSKTITLTPAAVAFGNSYSGVNHYTYTGLSLVNNNAYTSTGLQFFCNILSTAQTVTAQSPLLSYSTMFEDNILTFISSSDSIVKDWKNGGYTFAIASNQSEGETDFSIQGEITFNYYIDKVGLTVTANDKTITYGDAPATNGVSYSGFVNNEGTNLITPSISCSTSYTQYGNVGTYAIVPSGTISATNYEVGTLVNGTLTVSKKAITITANDKTIAYGDVPSNAGVEYSGLVTGEGDTLHNLSGTITYEYSYTQYGPVGNYDITPSGITSTNYDITYVDGVLTVGKKHISITANDKTITYGAAPSNNGISATGLVNGDTVSVLSGVTYTYSYHQYDDIGSYTITPGGTITATNYTVTEINNGTLTVNQAPLKIKFNDTKDLYDSIIDYYNNNYDFIYVQTNTSTHTSSLTSNFWTTYNAYFPSIVLADGTELPFASNVRFVAIANSYTTQNSPTTAYAYALTFEWNGASESIQLNYNISSVVYKTTGAASSYTGVYIGKNSSNEKVLGGGGETARDGVNVRILITPQTSTTGTDYNVTYSNNSTGHTEGTLKPNIIDWNVDIDEVGIIKFINARYYDKIDDSFLTLGYNTTYYLNQSIHINRSLNGSRMLPSYKTIDGYNSSTNTTYGIYVWWGGDTTDTVAGRSNPNSNNNPIGSYTTNQATFNAEYPAYTTVNGVTYYGAGILLAINYGTLKNISLYTFIDKFPTQDNNTSWAHQSDITMYFKAYSMGNTAIGCLVGINKGTIGGSSNASCHVSQGRQLTVTTDANYITAFGVLTGINDGTISYSNGKTLDVVYDGYYSWGNQQRDARYPQTKVVGSCTAAYVGQIAGYNNGTISNLSYTANYSAASGTNLPNYVISQTATAVSVVVYSNNAGDGYALTLTSGNAYYGAVVGLNNGSISEATVSINGSNGHTSDTTASIASAGGVVGYNQAKGGISNINVNIASGQTLYALTKATSSISVIGGVAGINAGSITNCAVTNAGTIRSGNVSYNLYAVTGGIAGINSDLNNSTESNGTTYIPTIINCSVVIQSSGKINASKAEGSGDCYTGGLIAVGCENGTYDASHRVAFAGYNIDAGVLSNSTMFNYGKASGNYTLSIGADNGYWGYLTGYYNSILSNSPASHACGGNCTYEHEYGGLVWYTQYDTSADNGATTFEKTLFGRIASILGYNGNLSSTNVYITGIAGIGLSDCGDGDLASSLLNNVELDAANSQIIISYNSFTDQKNAAGYYQWDCSVNGNPVAISTATNNNSYSTNFGAGTLTASVSNTNAIIRNTEIEASVANFIIRPYVYISNNTEYVRFVQKASGYELFYSAGYATISANYTVDGVPWAATLGEKKTVDGNDHTITYQNTSDSNGNRYQLQASSRLSATSSEEKTYYIAGNLIGINKGSIINLTIELKTSERTIQEGTSAENYAYGIISAINQGTIQNCRVNITGSSSVGLLGSSSGLSYAFGPIAAISFGTISGCTVQFTGGATACIDGTTGYNTSKPGYVGGIVGISTGGTIENCVVLGNGNIKAINSYGSNGIEANLKAYVGGIAGVALVNYQDNSGSIAVGDGTNIQAGKTTIRNLVVALVGDISSSAASEGGTGYITGKAFATNDKNTLDTILGSYNFGKLFVLAGGNPTIVSKAAPKVQNTIFGGSTVEATANSYTDLTALSTVLVTDYSEKGLGAFTFIGSIHLTYVRQGEVQFLTDANSTSIAAGDNGIVTLTFTNGGTESPSISSVLTTKNNSSILSTEIKNNIAADSTSTTNVTSATNNPWIKYTINYSVTIAGESLVWDNAQTLNNSNFVNFISGRGNVPYYAGAKEATLLGSITYDKHAHASIVFAEGKVLNGNGYSVSSTWVGDTTNTIAGVSDSISNDTPGKSSIALHGSEYPYTYPFGGVNYYGISDLISINYGTIQNITVVLPSTHYYNGLDANVAYGSLVGINAGTITNCNVTISGAVTYSIGKKEVNTVVGGAVGINVGTISGLNVTLSNTYKIINTVEDTSSYGGNIVFATGVAINGKVDNDHRGSIEGINVVNNGSMQVGTPLAEGLTNSDLTGNNELGRKINSLTLAGIVAMNSGAALSFATISGEGSFLVNSKYYTNINSENNTADLVNFFDIQYAYFAVGVALVSNDAGTSSDFNTSINVYDSIINGSNAIKAIIIDYVGQIQLYASYYMVGLAFARSSVSTSVTSSNYRYKGIIWNEQYNSDIDLYTVNPSWGITANISAGSTSAGLALMGWVDSESNKSDFVAGTQIIANVTDLELSWEIVGSIFTGNIVLRTAEYGMKEKNPISSVGVYYLPNGEEKANIFNNSTYYKLDIGNADSKTELVYKAALVTNNVIVNDSTEHNGQALRITVTFNYPYVEINDVYQLVQFLWFDSNDSDNIANYYLRTYITEIRKLITNNLKKATGSNPYGAWVDVENTDIDRILSHYEEQDYYIYYFNSTYYYIFIERYYDEDGDEIRYYSANEARLGANISLSQYGNATPDFGFDKTTSITFPETKALDGMGYTITLIVNDYNRTTYNALPTTSKWYDSSNENNTAELTFSDTQNTPSKGESNFVYGGFVGINRGHLQNIVFSFKAGSILNITADGGIGQLSYRRNIYAGLVCAYSTGVIDGCTLVMEDNTQFFINKQLPSLDGNFFDPKSDHDYYGGVYMGGFVGLLGYEGVISNSTVTFGANAYLGAHNVGNNGIGMGHIYTYVGGFAGMMTRDSKIYNAKIEGEATSRIFATITSANFTRVVTGAGGVVGVNTTTSTWNQWNIGEGTIDGVIYNWKGRTISPYWNGGLAIWGWEPNLGGDRETLTIYQLGGNVAGVIGNSSNNSWETNTITNLYYTFDINDYAVSSSDKETFLTLRYYVVSNNERTGATNTAQMNLYNNSNKNSYVTSANASVSDARSGVASLNNSIKVISIYKMPYSNTGTSNTGITIAGGTATEYNNGKSIVTLDYTSFSVSDSVYEKVATVGDLLSWNSKLPGADIKCHFVAGQDNASAVMWQITIVNAVSPTGSSLQNPESGHTAVTEIPVYKFAKSLEEAQTYRVMDYVIQRGQGNGMALYYCMGDAAVLSPDSAYYSNEVTDDTTVYYPKKAIMYDGNTDGNSMAVKIYDATGHTIGRRVDLSAILTSAGSSISRVTKVYKNGVYTTEGTEENEALKKVGSYQVQFTIKTNGLNNNAYVDSRYRVLFFNAQGDEAERTYTANDVTTTYVKRGNYYYEKVMDYALATTLEGLTPTVEGIYTYDAINYTKVNGAFYKSSFETNDTIIAALNAGVGDVETYTIYMVIAPVAIKLTSITKLYDGYATFNYTAGTANNYTTFAATLDYTYTYANEMAIPTISSTHGKLELRDGSSSKVSITPKGEYDAATVGERTAIFNIDGSITYTLYRYDEVKNAWYTMNITTYYLDDAASSTTYFTISDLTTIQSIDNTTHVETYGWASPSTTYSIEHSDAQGGCIVKIYKAVPPTISFDSAIVKEYIYNAQNVDYVTNSDLLSHIQVTTVQGDTWAATNSTYFGPNDFTIVQDVTNIKNVQTTAYSATVTVSYIGTQFASTSTQLTLSIYVLPAELTVLRVVKDYDGTTAMASATTVMQGFMGTDTIGAVTGSYASENVGKNINVTFSNTTNTSINSRTYELIFNNYYLSKKTWNVGVIAPIEAEIINAYKMYDGTDTVSYTGTTGINATSLLIKSGNDVIEVAPNGSSYTSNQVGTCGFKTTLEAFQYVAANGASITRYIIKNGNNKSNYYIAGASAPSYTAANKGSIIPAKVVVSSVYKEYDGNTNLGTFVMSGQINDEYPAFDGSYSSANVVYSSGAYNDIYLNAASITLEINNGTAKSSQTYHVLKYSGNNTNYELDTTDNGASLNGSLYTIAGQGVIIPAAITVTNVTKYYDASTAFNTSNIFALNDNNVGATINYKGATISNFVFTGNMSEKDAGTGYDVTVATTAFVYNNVTYNWLYNSLNSSNNYRVDTTTFEKVGTILQLTIKVASSTNTGNISNIYFATASGSKMVNANHYVSGATTIHEAVYKYGQTYSTANFCGKLTIGGTSYNITNGSCTVDGSNISFTLDKSVTNAGIHQFTISMSSAKSNYTLDASNKTFYFGIDKQTVDAANMMIVMSNLSKTYNGTNSTPTTAKATAIRAQVDEGNIDTWNSKTYGDVSITIGANCINVGTYQQGSGTNRFVLSESIICESTNYKFNGTVSNVYSSTVYSSLTTYSITKASLIPVNTITKEFDGLAAMEVELNGVNGEKVIATYSYTPSASGLGILPGSYTGSVSVSHSNTNYNSLGAQNIALTIDKAKIVLERQYTRTVSGIAYFDLALSFTNIKGYDFLTFANPSFTNAMASDLVANGVESEDPTMLPAFVAALNSLLVFKCNDATATTEITVDMLYAVNVYQGADGFKTLEILIKGEETLDNETLTDRYSVYMMGINEVNEVNEITASVIASNIAVSSSELADGQYNGTLTTTGTAITTIEELVTFVNAGSGSAYLTNNIYGFDASKLTLSSAFAGTLYGNGYTIELVGGYNNASTYYGAFIAVNSGLIQDVNFKFLSNVEIETGIVGLVVGSNTGTILNCSVDIGVDLTIKAEATPNIGGLVGTSSGTLENVSVVYSANVTYDAFGGIANTITNGTATYVTARNNTSSTSLAGKPIAVSTTITISNVIDAMSFTNTLVGSGTLDNVYGQGSTALAMYANSFTNGYLDYYFTTKTKFATAGVLHNEYNTAGEENVNRTHYYGYDSTKADSYYYVAIEVIAPLNRFVWEAFDAYYTTYGTSLNRVVGLFALTQDLTDTGLTLNTNVNSVQATIFTPVIGRIVSTVISAGTDMIKEYEYTGSRITATFEAEIEGDPENTITLTIAGTDVGVYTEYYEEVAEGEQSSDFAWDIEGFTAQIITSSASSVGEQSIMLIIVPKQINDTPTLTKQYDSTNIAETHIDTNSDSQIDIYAVGEFNNTAVGTGYEVKYNSTTKPVAAYVSNNVYTFVTYHLSGYDKDTNTKIYTVEFIYVNGSAFTSSTNVTALSKANFARAYYELVTLDELQTLANTANTQIIYKNPIGSISNLTSVYVYDLTFGRTTDEHHEVTWGNSVSYSVSLYNVNGTLNRNYNYLLADNAFSGNSIFASATSTSTIQKVVSQDGGSITQRTVNGAYTNLNQSYRKDLQAIGIEIADVSDLDNIPYSLTAQQKTALISAINTELSGSISFSGDVLAATIADEDNVDRTKITYNSTTGKYHATNEAYTTVHLTALTGTYSVTSNLAVVFASGATLTLRYFEYDATSERFIIDTFDALLMIDNAVDGEGEYQTLDYIITRNLNGKSQLVETFGNTFRGTIDGNNKIIRNFTLVGSDATGLFSILAEGASITNVTFMNVLAIATTNADMSVVAATNNGAISGVKVEATFVSDGTIAIKPFATTNTGTIASSIAIVETSKAVASTTITALANNETVVLYRTYGLAGSVAFYIDGVLSNYASVSNDAKAVMQTNRLNTPVTITNEVVQINNFREYWVYLNIFRYLCNPPETFIGYQFVL